MFIIYLYHCFMACVPLRGYPRLILNLDQIFSCQLTHQSAQLGQQTTTLTRLEAKMERIEQVLGASGLYRRGSVASLCSIASSFLSIGQKQAWKGVYRDLHLNGITLTADMINAKKEELCKLFRTNSILELSSSGEPDEEGVQAPQSPDKRSRPTAWRVRDYVVAQLGDPLHRAAFHGQTDLVQELLDKGANIDARAGIITRYGWGFTALNLATAEGHLEVVKVLLDRGASIVTNLFRTTALHAAAQPRDTSTGIEIVKLLLERGASINAANLDGDTPLYYATGYFDYLVFQRRKPNRHVEILTFLLENGARTDVRNSSGETPLDFARWSGWDLGVKVLTEHIANNSEPVPSA